MVWGFGYGVRGWSFYGGIWSDQKLRRWWFHGSLVVVAAAAAASSTWCKDSWVMSAISCLCCLSPSIAFHAFAVIRDSKNYFRPLSCIEFLVSSRSFRVYTLLETERLHQPHLVHHCALCVMFWKRMDCEHRATVILEALNRIFITP